VKINQQLRRKSGLTQRTLTIYPFSAIVGQEKMKMALILNVINPKIGGVLLRGEKGTGKSLTVRALANLLPETTVVAGCPFHCDPKREKDMCDDCNQTVQEGKNLPVAKRSVKVVELPVGATEDRLVGTIDIEKAIKQVKNISNPVFSPKQTATSSTLMKSTC